MKQPKKQEKRIPKIFLAFYKYKRPVNSLQSLWFRICDNVTKFFTKGNYSHCELAVEQEDGTYLCYSSSVRDKGVRKKVIDILDCEKWDLEEVTYIKVTPESIEEFFQATKDKKYDLIGALGIVLRIKDNANKYFCSEWCAECIGYPRAFEYSPVGLYNRMKERNSKYN